MDPAGSTGGQDHHQVLPYDGMTAQQGSTETQCALSRTFSCSFPHFAMVYVDNNGDLGVNVSSSLAGCERAIFTEDIKQSFVRAVTTEWQPNMHNFASAAGAIGEFPDRQPYIYSNSVDLQPNPVWFQHGQPRQPRLIPCEFQSLQNKRQRRSRKRTSSELGSESDSDSSSSPSKRTAIRVGQTDLLRQFYEKAFDNLQQLNCRVIAKAFVKLVEPRKQVNHPYNGRRTVMGGPCQRLDPELTKPKWWPAGVQHKEPDHLLKAERIRLLMHILCELRESHGITAQKLREAGQDVRRQIEPAERLLILDEIYDVREMEELYLSGRMSADMILHVSSKHLPEGIDSVSEQQNSETDCLPLSPVSISRKSSVESGLSSVSKGMESSIISSEQTRAPHSPPEVPSAETWSVPGLYTQQSVLLDHGLPRAHATLTYH